MLRGFAIAFVAGWLLWFWIDKSPSEFSRLSQPRGGQYAADFQVAVDLVRTGRFTMAYVYIWKAHFVVLSAAVGLLIHVLFEAIARSLSRRRLIRLYVPNKRRPPDTE